MICFKKIKYKNCGHINKNIIRKMNKLKPTGEKIYCPYCYIVEWRTKNILIPGFLNFAKIKKVSYLHSTPESEYPKELENARGDRFCGNCHR